MTETEAAWLAALVDGEGCIGLRVRNGRPQGLVRIANNHRGLLEVAQRRAGCGAIYDVHQGGSLVLYVGKRSEVVGLLEAIEPHLIIKREKALQVLAALGYSADCAVVQPG